jgi:predicted lipoprotein with Yx(FWY)xxD motif
MMIGRTTKLAPLAAVVAVGAAVIAAGCGSSASTSTSTSTSTPASAPSTSSTASGTPAGGAALKAVHGSAGTYLTDAAGRALYLWVADSNGKSSCSGACAQTWPPVTTKGAPTGSSGVKAADVSAITRSDGSKQVAYAGHPLYYFAGDTGPGTTSGQGSGSFGAKWWLVAPSGKAITGGGAPAGSSSSSAGGGWG